MRRRKNKSTSIEEISEVNVTPLADVSLTLVIMMMVISPMIFQSMIEVKPSQAVATKSQERVEEKPVFVDITRDGIRINNKKIENEYHVYRILQGHMAKKTDRTVMITAAKNVEYHNVIRILDLVRQSGATNLSLVPRKKA